MDEHQLIVAVKELSLELGCTPTLSQCRTHISNFRANILRTSFNGSYPQLLTAAGLVPHRTGRITNEIFQKDIDRHLDEYQPKEIKERKPWPKIAILGDLHAPFDSDLVKAEFVSFCGSFQPEYIVQIGDLFDMFSHSKFPRSQNLFTPKDEETAAKKRVEAFWRGCQKAAPKAKCVGLLGNHDVRPLKRTLESAPTMEHWIEKYFSDLMTFDGVEMILDAKQEYIISDIAFLHGYMSKLGSHRDFMLMNAVRGHDHVGGCVFKQIHGKVLWELDVGLAGDFNAKGFDYRNQRMTNWTNGYGAIDHLGPRFIPL
jgi:hypothetical protein